MITKLRMAALGLGAAGFLGLAIVALWYRGSAIAAEAEARKALAEREIAIEANRMMGKALDQMTQLRERENAIIAELTIELRDINDRFAAQAEAITDLEAANEGVRDYLNAPIPDDLRRLYDKR